MSQNDFHAAHTRIDVHFRGLIEAWLLRLDCVGSGKDQCRVALAAETGAEFDGDFPHCVMMTCALSTTAAGSSNTVSSPCG